jgi:hypothetical protein
MSTNEVVQLFGDESEQEKSYFKYSGILDTVRSSENYLQLPLNSRALQN